ncbi:putative ribose-phosphate pyrophosphokinase [Leishmania infantum JPCM5]|uniref:Ribose-phosphate_pyrophosphokinase_-_putative n=2 Tax=Leishmania infantum TaxID=5671 RepID=A0A6L0WN34_LEIIN|nr:putative ribose-phosphate pyrophosphokinase [Leishmania infantum JPCM5]CAC9451177.1 ribose-phosphate_pyrophosphokinase_-_putative [Leishmania infantum]CAM65751.1 putative ribose-phosphate pyrophosphokinase [Leishmania infantum JPCM5]SUZ39368.1 ribose-phosphate_pyrophosphokinase_-_putative [Leishmania infantum]|eukprot:XP_001463390.1 putative ribose-phosphate pyrophosphokinase [Leishmania infantum JPCM5]
MLKTGKDLSQGQAFHRQLLSEYNTEITLDNYVSYFELKPIAKKIEHIRQALESTYRDRYAHRSVVEPSLTSTLTITEPLQVEPVQPCLCETSAAVTPTGRRDDKEFPASPVFVTPRGRQQHITTTMFTDPLSPLFFETPGFRALKETDKELAALIQRRIQLQERFFEKLHESYMRVKRYLIKLERDFVNAVAELRTFNEDHIRNELPRNYIPSLYLKLEVIVKYRALNLKAFRKILKKFQERCACDSLELLQRVVNIDRLIYASNISQPSIDFRSAALDLIVVYGTVFRLTYEQAVRHMKQYENRTGVNAQRILPNSQTFFVADAFPHHERPGTFAVRVLSGTCSLFCEKMITEVLQCPRYPGNSCGRFANGEVSVNLQAPVRGDDVFVVQSMVALESENLSNAGALMELALLVHSAQLAAAARITAVIPYLAYTSNVASISAVAEMIELVGCHHVITVDMHSDQVEGMFSIPIESASAMYEFVRYVSNLLESEGNTFENITVVAPSGEFLGRTKEYADALMRYNNLDSATQFVSVCTAVRRVETQPLACTTRTNRHDYEIPRVIAESHRCTGLSSSGEVAHECKLQQQQHGPVTRSTEWGTPNSSTAASMATSHINVNTPIDAQGKQYLHSPATPPAADAVTSELVAIVGSESQAVSFSTHSYYASTNATAHGGTHSLLLQRHGEPDMQRSSSTLGIEKALRQQEEGPQALIMRKETASNEYKNYVLVGDVKDRLCIIIETVIDEAINMAHVARCLQEQGAERIILVATHAVMSGNAINLLVESPIELVVVTDSVNQDELMKNPALARKLRVVPIAPLLARAIEKIHTENTLATLFDKS